MLMNHTVFLAKDSPSASVKLIETFAECLNKIETNPLMYQFADNKDIPGVQPKTYRRCVFGKHYKIVYRVDGQMIYVTAVIDARAENRVLYGDAQV
jgi:plasmid stabilization system protein ParE